MNIEQYVELIRNTTLADLYGLNIGVLTDKVIKFHTIPSIRQEMLPVYNRVSCVAAALEKKDAAFSAFIQKLAIPDLVAAAEQALTMPPSALEMLPIMEEIQAAYASGSEDDIQFLEATMVSLQTLEIAIAGTAPALSPLRAEEITRVLSEAKERPIPRPDPQPQPQTPMQPTPQDAAPVNKAAQLEEELSKDLIQILEIEKNVEEMYAEIKNAPRKKPPTVFNLLLCHYCAQGYLSSGERLMKMKDHFNVSDASPTALRMRQFSGTYPETSKKMRAVCADLLKIKPDLEEISEQIGRGLGRELPIDDPYAAEFTLLNREYDQISGIDQYVDLYKRYKKLGANLPEAYVNAASIIETARQFRRENPRGLPKNHFFSRIDCEEECVNLLVQYFCVSCYKGGDVLNSCIANLFYELRSRFKFDYLHAMEKRFLEAENAACAKCAAPFIRQMQRFGETIGAKARKNQRFASLLGKSSFAKPTMVQEKCALILYPIFLGVFSFLFAFLTAPLQNAVACSTLGLVATLVISALHILAMKFGAGHEKVFKIVTPLMLIPAFVGHLFYRFTFSTVTYGLSIWPGSAGTVFGPSFTMALMFLIPCCFLSRTTYAKLRVWLQKAIALHPFASVLFVLFFAVARLLSVNYHLQTIQGGANWFVALLAYLLGGAVALLPLLVSAVSNRAYDLFNKDKGLIFFIFSLCTVIGVVFNLWANLPLLNSAEPPFAFEIFFRMFNMQVFFFPVLHFFHITEDDKF